MRGKSRNTSEMQLKEEKVQLLKSFLVDQPVLSILVSLFSEWICTEDLANLDNAICEKSIRPIFLLLLKNCAFSSRGLHDEQVNQLQHRNISENLSDFHSFYEIYLRWIKLRSLKVRILVLPPSSLSQYDSYESIQAKRAFIDLTKINVLRFSLHKNADSAEKKDRQNKLLSSRAVLQLIPHTSKHHNETQALDVIVQQNTQRLLSFLDYCPSLSTFSIASFDFSESFGRQPHNNILLAPLVRKFSRISSLDASCCQLMSDDAITSLTSCCVNLRYINLSRNLQITDTSIAAIVSQCPNIIDINIFGCKALTDKSIHAISTNCLGLRTVNLRKCENITDSSIVSLAENCQQLQNITLNDCKNISNVVRKVAEYRRNLLSMSIFNFFNKLSDESLLKVAYCCPKLEAFRIGNCIDNSNISDVSVMKLASNCPLLRILHIERSGITDEALLKIASCCTQLKSLNVSDCSLTTVSAVQQLLEMCPSIEYIVCEYFEYKTSDKSLKVSGSKLTDSEVFRIIRCIPELWHVNLSNGENFQDVSIIRVVDKFSENLLTLTIAACEHLTDSCVSYLLDRCAKLTKLDVGYNRFSGVPFVDISDKAVRFTLKQLDISSCSMSTEVVIQILRVCPHLLVLFLNDKTFPFENIKKIYCSRQLSPQERQQLERWQQANSPSQEESKGESASLHFNPATSPLSSNSTLSTAAAGEKTTGFVKNIFANLYSPVFEFNPSSPPQPLEIFNNSYFQFKRDGFVLKVIKYQISEEDLLQILDLFSHLLCIDIQSPQTEKLTPSAFLFIADKFGSHLQSLTVGKYGRFRFTDELAAGVKQRCRALKELRVNSYDLI